MKALLVLAVAVALSSCAGLTITGTSPWGDISTVDGVTTIAPRPIIIPSK